MGGGQSVEERHEEIARIAQEQLQRREQQQQDEMKRLVQEQVEQREAELKRQQKEEIEREVKVQVEQERAELQHQQQKQIARIVKEQVEHERTELQQQQLEEIARIEEKVETVREEKSAELRRLQKELDERVRQDEVRQIVHEETSQQAQQLAIKSEQTKQELMGMLQALQVTIMESSGSQQKMLSDVQSRMATTTRVQAIVDEKMHSGFLASLHHCPCDHNDDPLLNSTPNTQAGFESLSESIGHPPDDVTVSRVYSLQVHEAPTSDESIGSEEPDNKRHANPTGLKAIVGSTEPHDEYQPKPHRKGSGLVAHTMEVQYTKASWNANSTTV